MVIPVHSSFDDEKARIFRFTTTKASNGDVLLLPESNSPSAHSFRHQLYLRWPAIPFTIKALGTQPYAYILIEKQGREWWSQFVSRYVVPPTPAMVNHYGKPIILITLPTLESMNTRVAGASNT